MLDHKARKEERQVEVKEESVIIPLPSFFSQQLALVIPPISKMDVEKSKIFPSIDIQNAKREIQEIEESLCRDEMEAILSKYDRFHGSETFLLRAAQASFYANEIERADSLFGELIDVLPDSYSKESYGDFLLDSGRESDAKAAFYDDDLSDSLYANLRRAFFSIRDKDFASAEVYLQKAISIDQLDFSANILLATLYMSEGKWMEAIGHLKVCLEEDLGSPAALIRIGYCYWRLNEHDKAKHFLRRAVGQNSLSLEALILYSDVCNALGVAEEAFSFLERYTTVDDSKAAVWERLARAAFSAYKKSRLQSYLDVCLDALRRELAISPSHRVWNNMGVVLWNSGKPNQAASMLTKALEEAHKDREDFGFPLFNLAGILIENKQFSRLKEIFSLYIDSDGTFRHHFSEKSERVLLQYLITLEGVGRRKEAIRLCQRKLESGVDDIEIRADLLNRLIYYYSVVEKDVDYIRDIESKLDNGFSWLFDIKGYARHRVLNNLAFAELCFDDAARAKKYLDRLTDVFHKDPYATATLGMWHLRRGRIERGKQLYREAISMLADRKEKNRFRQRMYLELGIAYDTSGDRSQAKRELRKALSEKDGAKWVMSEIKLRLKDS